MRADHEKLDEALELVSEVRESHRRTPPITGPLVEAASDIRQVRDYLEAIDDAE